MPLLQLPRSDAPPARARVLLFEDPLSLDLLRGLEQIAPTEATVLVTGETGTGKEIVARHVHERSRRARGPFIAVNCGALTPSLMESELFGHEKAAFTGALAAKPGWFEAAQGGTLFLDEIGDLPLAAQVKLLRVLQEREVVRIGARRPVPLDVRLVAATNANLAQAVAQGRFREDLFYRLLVATLTIPPLRDRPGDILPLARYFVATYAARLGLDAVELSEGACTKLLAHRWPGNIRELENALHRALVVKAGPLLDADDLNLLIAEPVQSVARTAFEPEGSLRAEGHRRPPEGLEPQSRLESALRDLYEAEGPNLLRRVEEAVFRTAYEFSDRNQLRTARLLGTSRNVMRARLLQHGVITGAGRDSDPPAPAPASASMQPARARVVRIACQAFGVLSLLKGTRALEETVGRWGIDVEWSSSETGMHVVDALAVGAADLGVVGEVPPILAQAGHAPLVYLASEPPAPRGEALVTLESSPVRRVADLAGARIAVARGSTAVYLLLRALEEEGLGLGDVEIAWLAPDEAREAFFAGSVGAWAIWNPFLSLVQQRGARTLRDAVGLANNRAFYVARRAFADERPDVVDAFLGQVAALGRWINTNRHGAADALAMHADLPANVLASALALTPFDLELIKPDALASQQRIADSFLREGFLARPIRVSEAVWTAPSAQRCSA